MRKYSQNLRVEGSNVYSYNTHVATIKGRQLIIHGHWSMTTSKHVNYVADEYGLERVYKDKKTEEAPKEESNPFKSVAVIASLGKLLGGAKTIKEENDWSKRMLQAGMGNAGLSFPDNWDQLSEKEKKRRLDGAIAIQLEKSETINSKKSRIKKKNIRKKAKKSK